MTDLSLIGKRLDEYHIVSQLGEGGMSTIYLGLDTSLQRYTAIKVIHTRLQNDPDSVARFKREAQAVARLDHPNIVRLYRYGQVEDILYMAMQYIEGVDLRVVLQNYRQDRELIPPADALRIIKEICQALDYAHQNGVLHRDVKPSNIMLNRDGRAILTDFGLALLPEVDTQGKAFGTPQYMSPEQAQDPAQVGPASDLYAVGMIIHEMMTGKLPFYEIENPMEMVARRASEPPPPPSLIQPEISPELEAVILKALSLNPAQRYQSGADLSAALENALPLPAETPPPEPEEPEPAVIPPTPAQVEAQAALKPNSPPLFIPAAVSPAPEQPIPTSPQSPPPETQLPPVSSTANYQRFNLPPITKPRLIALGGCALLALLAVVFIWGGVQLIRGQLLDQYRTWLPITTSDEGGSSAENGSGSNGAYPNPVVTEPAPGSSQEPGLNIPPKNHVLHIATNGDDSFFLVNIGQTNIPLAGLRFEEGDKVFNGAEWGLESLAPGQCVALWKDRGNPEAPDNVECTEVGNRVQIEPKDAFWKKDFNIIFQNTPIITCPKEGCDFFIPLQ